MKFLESGVWPKEQLIRVCANPADDPDPVSLYWNQDTDPGIFKGFFYCCYYCYKLKAKNKI